MSNFLRRKVDLIILPFAERAPVEWQYVLLLKVQTRRPRRTPESQNKATHIILSFRQRVTPLERVVPRAPLRVTPSLEVVPRESLLQLFVINESRPPQESCPARHDRVPRDPSPQTIVQAAKTGLGNKIAINAYAKSIQKTTLQKWSKFGIRK